jgi:predicted NBD/HSP70 family sugar kinase
VPPRLSISCLALRCRLFKSMEPPGSLVGHRVVSRDRRGAHPRPRAGPGAAGELGHAVIQDDGPPCPGCGNVGCLEALTAWSVLSWELPGAGDLSGALELARTGDGAARAVFERVADRVARALGPLINVLNPDLVLIGGTVGRNGYEVIRPALLRGPEALLDAAGRTSRSPGPRCRAARRSRARSRWCSAPRTAIPTRSSPTCSGAR